MEKRSCHPDVPGARVGRHLEPAVGDGSAWGELFVAVVPLGRVKSGH